MCPRKVPLGVREGYDRWAQTYDATPNPVVALDRRITLALLDPRPGERILDAGCGTGFHCRGIAERGASPVGVDFSRGMLEQARSADPRLSCLVADLHRPLPLADSAFDAVLCALVGEHLRDLGSFFRELRRVLRPGCRLVFSVYHPELAVAGIEANFTRGGVEYRLGAERHGVEDYRSAVVEAGLRSPRIVEHDGDAALVAQLPKAAKYLGRRLLLTLTTIRPA